MRPIAFISYANRHAEWVGTLQRNLELCLDREVFLDQTDLGSGQSWVRQLQAGISEAEHFVLVVTPEALASPRVMDEWGGFIASRRNWEGKLHLVQLVETPLPLFLAQIHHVDFRAPGEAPYGAALRDLVAGLSGDTNRRQTRELPEKIEIPEPPVALLPGDLRPRLVDWLAGVLKKRVFRMVVAQSLDLRMAILEGHASDECAASATLVTATADDEPLVAAVRIVGALLRAFEEEGEDLLLPLQEIRQALADLQSEQTAGGGLLGLYLENVRAEHSNLIPLSDDVSPLTELDRVYVKLELAPHEHAVVRKEGIDPFVRAQEIRQLLELDRAKHSWLTHRWVVRGDPGAGKTTLLRHLAWSLAGDTSPRWIPVFTSLPRWTRTQDWILDRVERNLLRAGKRAKGISTLLDRHGDEGRLLLLLDGLDEVRKEDRVEVETLLREVSQRWPRTPLVVTSRPIGYRRPANEFLELDILPLDAERQKSFLARWFGRRTGKPQPLKAAEVYTALQAGSSLGDLAKNPLYLTLIAWLVEDGQPLEHRRSQLYDQVFRMLLLGKHRSAGTAIECRDTVREVLQQLAFAMTVDNTDAEPVGKIERRLYQPRFDNLRHELERVPRWDRHMGQFLDDLAERTGVLGPHDGADADWRFWHRTFREALAAEALEHLHEEKGIQAILAHAKTVEGDESRWAEPFALLAGRIEGADELVKTLVRENSALGLRALATAQGLKAETLREVMALSTDWKERAKVYEEIPNQLGEPESALALLDQIRRQTKPRNGNDLFFIDQTMAAIGRETPDFERQVADLRGRLFDHIEAPPAELFQAIATPHCGRTELWCEIPQGEFLMGSPDDEEGRDDDEGPQHRVVITAPFRLAAVPVTQAQYAAFDPEHVSNFDHETVGAPHVDHPVEQVTWYAAVMFCRWLSTLPEFEGARLPTEEEWEYACRADSKSRFWSGDSAEHLADVGWYSQNSEGRTHRVGEKPPNGWGLYDMPGNVDEWTLSGNTDYEGRQVPVENDPDAAQTADLAATAASRVSWGLVHGVGPGVTSCFPGLGRSWVLGRGLGLPRPLAVLPEIIDSRMGWPFGHFRPQRPDLPPSRQPLPIPCRSFPLSGPKTGPGPRFTTTLRQRLASLAGKSPLKRANLAGDCEHRQAGGKKCRFSGIGRQPSGRGCRQLPLPCRSLPGLSATIFWEPLPRSPGIMPPRPTAAFGASRGSGEGPRPLRIA